MKFDEILTMSMPDFKTSLPELAKNDVFKEFIHDDSYFVRIGLRNNSRAVEVECSPDPDVWEYVK